MKELLRFVLVSSLFLGCTVYQDSARERQANVEAWKRERIQREQMEKQQQQKIHMEAGMEVKQKESPSTMEQWKTQIDQLQKQIVRKDQLPKEALIKAKVKWVEELTSLQNQVRKELVGIDEQKQSLQRRIQQRREYEQGVETFLANIFGAAQGAGQESYKPEDMNSLEWSIFNGLQQYYSQLQEIQYQIEHSFKLLTIE